MAVTLISLVRDRTTDDIVVLPDAKIQDYLDFHAAVDTSGNEWKLATADCLDYLARDDIYEQYARGQIRVSKPILHARAQELRAEVLGLVSPLVDATSSTMTRTDYGTQDTQAEYGGGDIPYTYGAGLLKTVKEDSGVS